MFDEEFAGLHLFAKKVAKALRKEEHKYFLVRGLEYRRLLKVQAKPDNLHTISEIGDIYLLEQK